MNVWRMLKRRHSKLVDARPLMQEAIDIADSGDKERRDAFLSALKDGYSATGKHFLKRAYREHILTRKEVTEMNKNMGLTMSDWGTLLQPVFALKDGHIPKEDQKNTYIVTSEGSKVYKHRKSLQKKMGVLILSSKEAFKKLGEEK